LFIFEPAEQLPKKSASLFYCSAYSAADAIFVQRTPPLPATDPKAAQSTPSHVPV